MDQILFNRIPNLSHEEYIVLKNITQELSKEALNTFLNMYLSKRQSPDIVLITCLVGLFGISGIHRFLMGQIGMGILWLLTGGLCAIGTIVDAFNYKNLALDYNQKMALETMYMLKS